eukprot:tig00020723_g13516.t1
MDPRAFLLNSSSGPTAPSPSHKGGNSWSAADWGTVHSAFLSWSDVPEGRGGGAWWRVRRVLLSVRTQSLLAVFFLQLLVFVIVGATMFRIIPPRFADLERADADAALARLVNSLSDAAGALSEAVMTNANWDEPSQLAFEGLTEASSPPPPQFLDSLYGNDVLKAMDIEFAAHYDREGRFLFGRRVGGAALPPGFQRLAPSHPLMAAVAAGKLSRLTSGLYPADFASPPLRRTLLTVAAPLAFSNYSGDADGLSAGLLIFARVLSEKQLLKIAHQSQTCAMVVDYPSEAGSKAGLPADLAEAAVRFASSRAAATPAGAGQHVSPLDFGLVVSRQNVFLDAAAAAVAPLGADMSLPTARRVCAGEFAAQEGAAPQHPGKWAEGEERLASYAVVADGLGAPALLVRADIALAISEKGFSTLWTVIGSFAGGCGALVLVTLVYIEAVVARPVSRLTRALVALTADLGEVLRPPPAAPSSSSAPGTPSLRGLPGPGLSGPASAAASLPASPGSSSHALVLRSSEAGPAPSGSAKQPYPSGGFGGLAASAAAGLAATASPAPHLLAAASPPARPGLVTRPVHSWGSPCTQQESSAPTGASGRSRRASAHARNFRIRSVGPSLEFRFLSSSINRLLRLLLDQKAQSERLLYDLVPASIAARIKAGEARIADAVPEATVLFADICGFTAMSSQLEPLALVSLLNTVFSRIDEVIAAHRAEKIKNIGDAVMICTGLHDHAGERGEGSEASSADGDSAAALHAREAVEVSLALLDAINALNAAHGLRIKLRIGLCSGPLVTGVIGSMKKMYDIWGDTCNVRPGPTPLLVASRMEQLAEPDTIAMPEATVRLLCRDPPEPGQGVPPLAGLPSAQETFVYPLEPAGVHQVKGKGAMSVWRLRPRRLWGDASHDGRSALDPSPGPSPHAWPADPAAGTALEGGSAGLPPQRSSRLSSATRGASSSRLPLSSLAGGLEPMELPASAVPGPPPPEHQTSFTVTQAA